VSGDWVATVLAGAGTDCDPARQDTPPVRWRRSAHDGCYDFDAPYIALVPDADVVVLLRGTVP
jgi:hypothetical protein